MFPPLILPKKDAIITNGKISNITVMKSTNPYNEKSIRSGKMRNFIMIGEYNAFTILIQPGNFKYRLICREAIDPVVFTGFLKF